MRCDVFPGIEVAHVVNAEPQPPAELGPRARRSTGRRSERDVRILRGEPFRQSPAARRLFAIRRKMQVMAAARQLGDARLEEAYVRVVAREQQDLHSHLT